jgi:hypothetical protein
VKENKGSGVGKGLGGGKELQIVFEKMVIVNRSWQNLRDDWWLCKEWGGWKGAVGGLSPNRVSVGPRICDDRHPTRIVFFVLEWFVDLLRISNLFVAIRTKLKKAHEPWPADIRKDKSIMILQVRFILFQQRMCCVREEQPDVGIGRRR